MLLYGISFILVTILQEGTLFHFTNGEIRLKKIIFLAQDHSINVGSKSCLIYSHIFQLLME